MNIENLVDSMKDLMQQINTGKVSLDFIDAAVMCCSTCSACTVVLVNFNVM